MALPDIYTEGIASGWKVIDGAKLLGKKAKAAGGKLVICGPVGMVKEIIEESGLDAFFNIYSSVEDLD